MPINTTDTYNVGSPGHSVTMTLADYCRKFPNIDWSKPSPAAEFAMAPQDVDRVFAEMKTQP